MMKTIGIAMTVYLLDTLMLPGVEVSIVTQSSVASSGPERNDIPDSVPMKPLFTGTP